MALGGWSDAGYGDQSTIGKRRLGYVVELMYSALRGPCHIIQRDGGPHLRVSQASPEITHFRVGPKPGNLRAGRLSHAGPRRSAHLVDFRTPFSPETPCNARGGDVGTRAAGI